jgi:hypothetical protein
LEFVASRSVQKKRGMYYNGFIRICGLMGKDSLQHWSNEWLSG